MMGNGASLSFKGPLSLVCRAAGESMKVFFFFFLKIKTIMLLSKRIHSCKTFQVFLIEPFIMSNAF